MAMKYIVSVSFGKDSLCMLLKLLEKGTQIDDVVFYDTGMEFQSIYENMRKVEKILQEKKIHFAHLKPEMPFIYSMLDKPVKHRNGSTSYGYKWCGGRCRWGTSQKVSVIKKYLNQYSEYREYVGIAYDEQCRMKPNTGKLYPLVDWEMTEAQCLEYCHKKGFSWYEGEHELYEYLDRVSCWCCRNKNLKELRNIYENFNVYWLALCELENRCGMQMKAKSLRDLEEKWKKEQRLF